MIKYKTHSTPIGALALAESEIGLCRILFPGEEPTQSILSGEFTSETIIEDDRACSSVSRQLDEYFAGERRQFDLTLDLRTTAFFRQVLLAVAEIPYGQTAAYSTIANKIGKPRAVRAVGAANARNPIPIVIPCHRVVGKNGKLTGYGGGLHRKSFLLNLERKRN